MTTIWRELRGAITDKAFWLILLAAGLGFAGYSPWLVISLMAVLLTLWSSVSDQHWYDEFKRARRLDALAWFWLGCLVQNVGFIGAAFVLGHLVRWWWF